MSSLRLQNRKIKINDQGNRSSEISKNFNVLHPYGNMSPERSSIFMTKEAFNSSKK
jgi:hypothetical protein